jgi:transcriptional regulator with XRE-family HTH domain/tetratricopeptide (TPR) repeat protein
VWHSLTVYCPLFISMRGENALFGNWVRRRRRVLDLTQEELAQKVNCSLSMLRKIERDERRPSEQLAKLLADQLAIEDSQRNIFLQLAQGKFVPDIEDLSTPRGSLIPIPVKFSQEIEGQSPFVARSRELVLLHEHLERALEGQGRMVFIAGEAGRGKTSLLYEFAHQSIQAYPNLIVVGGSSDIYTGQGDPLLPFRTIFRMLAADFENTSIRRMISRELAARLVKNVPVFTEILINQGPHLVDSLIPGTALETHLVQGYPHHPKNAQLLLRLKEHRAREASPFVPGLPQNTFFEEIANTLIGLAQHQPMVLALDDLHWIDHSSAALLGYLSKLIKPVPILLVGSYRPEDLTLTRVVDVADEPVQHPLQVVLSESMRQFGQNRIDLDHFDLGEELEFTNALLDMSENELGAEFREHLAKFTEGHPLFVIELLRDMGERGDILQGEDGIWREGPSMRWDNFPAEVEGVIEKRIKHLPENLRLLLTIASVQGDSFFAEVIAAVSKTEPHQLIRQLSSELNHRYRLIYEHGIQRVVSERLSQYRFRHHLFQIYLYEHLGAAERMYFHEAVGNALESLLSGTGELPAAQLARHFQEARLSEKASQYLLLAGQQACRLLAFDEAIAHFESGLLELKRIHPSLETSRLEYEFDLNLARARWHDGRVKEAVIAFQDAIEIARSLEDPQAFGQAVLAYEEPRWRLNLGTELSQPLMREALVDLGKEQSGLRVRLLVGLARSLLASGKQDELRTTVDQALHIARGIKDQVALCDALRIRAHIDRRPESTDERLATIQELISTAKSIGDLERLADGYDLYVYDLLELGQIDLVDKVIEDQRQIAYEIKQPFQIHVAAVFKTMRFILGGDFGKAEELAKEAADISQQIGIEDLDGIFGTHMFTIRREQGRINEIAKILKILVANNPLSSAWRPGLALIYSSLDQLEEARVIFNNLANDRFVSIPKDSLWVGTMAYLSEVCAFLSDDAQATILYDMLLPYKSHAVVVGGATVCFGAAGRFLSILAKTMSKWELAERHIKEAMDLDKRMKAWPWLAHSQAEYATILLEKGQGENLILAQALFDEALKAAQRMGMGYLMKKIETLQVHYGLP